MVYGADGLTRRAQARDLLALAAAEHWGLSPLPELHRAAHGKPCFPREMGRHFNLSHSGPLALCVLDDAPAGADIQVVKRWRPTLPRQGGGPGEPGRDRGAGGPVGRLHCTVGAEGEPGEVYRARPDGPYPHDLRPAPPAGGDPLPLGRALVPPLRRPGLAGRSVRALPPAPRYPLLPPPAPQYPPRAPPNPPCPPHSPPPLLGVAQ